MAAESAEYSSDSSSNPEESPPLCERIVKMFERSKFDQSNFIPAGCIEELISEPSVIEKELVFPRKEPKAKSNVLVAFILRQAAKIFAIMVVARFSGREIHKAITHLMHKDIGDKDLPFLEAAGDSQRNLWYSPQHPWAQNSIRLFSQEQWAFLAPVFSSSNPNMTLHPSAILPFTWKDGDVKAGAFGDVFQVAVHPHHYKDPILKSDGQPATVAVKVIKAVHLEDAQKSEECNATWEREVQAHIDINKLKDDHIIEFIAAVTRGQRILLFRWADGGTLQNFWNTNRRPQLSVHLVRDVTTQIKGLADALDKLHSFGGAGASYRHGDIKPDNILRVKKIADCSPELDLGVLKIADLGLAKHHTVNTELRVHQTSMKYTTYRYEPPEAHPALEDPLQGRSRRQDIWSIGCVMLEMIVWMLYGSDALKEFNDSIVGDLKESSPYFEIDHGTTIARVHQAVRNTLTALTTDQECKAGKQTAIGSLLGIVTTKLLVVNVGTLTASHGESATSPSRRSSTPAGCRASARDLCLALDGIISKGKENPGYWYTGKSRSHISGLPKMPSRNPGSLLSPGAASGGGIFTNRMKDPQQLPSESISFAVPVSIINQNQKACISYSNSLYCNDG